jgi:hypothetical protein
MNTILGPFRQLVQRRLWPLAVLLIVAAVALPKLLADEDPGPVPAGAPVADSGSDPLTDEAVVAVAGQDASGRRRVLGARKDPFKPSGVQPKAAKSTSDSASSTSSDATASSGSSTSSSGAGESRSSTGGAPAATDPAPAATPAPTTASETFELYSLVVRLDDERRTLKRLDPLPDPDAPSIIYLGLLEDERTAVFLLDADVRAEGDGTCRPSPEDCQRLHLKKGETEFFDVGGEGGAQYQLDLLDIKTKRTTSAKKAAAARAATSSAGRRALRSRIARAGRLRYDEKTGKLREVSAKAARAALARVTAAAAAGR